MVLDFGGVQEGVGGSNILLKEENFVAEAVELEGIGTDVTDGVDAADSVEDFNGAVIGVDTKKGVDVTDIVEKADGVDGKEGIEGGGIADSEAGVEGAPGVA